MSAVYLVWSGEYDDWSMLGVFASRAGAQALVDRKLRQRKVWDAFYGDDAMYDRARNMDDTRWHYSVGGHLLGWAATKAEARALVNAHDASELFSIDRRTVRP